MQKPWGENELGGWEQQECLSDWRGMKDPECWQTRSQSTGARSRSDRACKTRGKESEIFYIILHAKESHSCIFREGITTHGPTARRLKHRLTAPWDAAWLRESLEGADHAEVLSHTAHWGAGSFL